MQEEDIVQCGDTLEQHLEQLKARKELSLLHLNNHMADAEISIYFDGVRLNNKISEIS